jgi:hypothetical protein
VESGGTGYSVSGEMSFRGVPIPVGGPVMSQTLRGVTAGAVPPLVSACAATAALSTGFVVNPPHMGPSELMTEPFRSVGSMYYCGEFGIDYDIRDNSCRQHLMFAGEFTRSDSKIQAPIHCCTPAPVWTHCGAPTPGRRARAADVAENSALRAVKDGEADEEGGDS